LLLIGYFEGVDSERGIAWRVADSISLREFLGYTLSDPTPDQTTISRNRRLIEIETHQEVFGWVLEELAKELGIETPVNQETNGNATIEGHETNVCHGPLGLLDC